MEGFMQRVTELLLDIVWKATWYRDGRSSSHYLCGRNDTQGKLLMGCLLETNAATILEFVQRLHGTLSLTFEEGPRQPGYTIS